METRLYLSFLTLFLTWNGFVMSYMFYLTPERVDQLLFKSMPIGDSTNKFPENASDYLKICNEISTTALRPDLAAIFMGPVLRVKEFRENAKTMFKEKMNNKLCQLAKNETEKYATIAKELNEEHSKLIPIRQSYTNAMVAATKPDSNINSKKLICFFQKWLSETGKNLASDTTKSILKQHIETYLKLIEKAKPLPPCDWSDFPKVEKPKFKSIEMLFFEAGKVVFALKKPKTTTTSTTTTTTTPGSDETETTGETESTTPEDLSSTTDA